MRGWVNATAGTVSARYAYGPFGEPLRATGPLADDNPFRFSTKYRDAETELYYYGYRYYNPSTGRWLRRDPIAERGGIVLYGITAKMPTIKVDYDGRGYSPWPGHPPLCFSHRCSDRCNPTSGPCLAQFEVKLTVPPLTPEEDDELDAAVAELDKAHSCADPIDFSTDDPVSLIFSQFLPSINSIYSSARAACLNNRAWLWTRPALRKCEKKRCFPHFWKKRYDWIRQPSSSWKKCRIGLRGGKEFYGGRSDALPNVLPCLQAHYKELQNK